MAITLTRLYTGTHRYDDGTVQINSPFIGNILAIALTTKPEYADTIQIIGTLYQITGNAQKAYDLFSGQDVIRLELPETDKLWFSPTRFLSDNYTLIIDYSNIGTTPAIPNSVIVPEQILSLPARVILLETNLTGVNTGISSLISRLNTIQTTLNSLVSSPNPTPTPTPTPTLWLPSALPLALWLDASDVATISTVSNGVSQWNDKSSNARHATQPLAANRPLYSIAARNGLNVLLFDSASSFLQGALSLTGNGEYTGNLSLFWVGTRSSTGGGTVFVERLSTRIKGFYWFQIAGVNYISSDAIAADSNHTVNNDTYDLVGNTGAIVSHTHKFGIKDVLSVNGVAQIVGGGIATQINGGNGYLIGVNIAANGYWYSGEIWEIIAVAGLITPIEEEKLTGHLAHKWGLTANLSNSHPYKSSLPYT